MNKVMLTGRLTKEPRISTLESGTTMASYTLAVKRRKREGQDQDADFITCISFGRTAELIRDYVGKGSKILVVGEIRTGSYEDKNGKMVYTTDAHVNEIEFLDTKKKEDDWENAGDDFRLPF